MAPPAQSRTEGHAAAELLSEGFGASLHGPIQPIRTGWNHRDHQIQSRQFADQRWGIALQDQFAQTQVQRQLLAQSLDLQALQPLTEQKLQHKNPDQPAPGQQTAPQAKGFQLLLRLQQALPSGTKT